MNSEGIHETRTRVRYQETDQMGVVYHSNYIIYFELGRTEWLRTQGMTYAEMEKQGMFLAVTDAQARYLASAFYDDVLLIRTRLVDHGPVTVRFGYEVFNEKTMTLLCKGTTELACLDSNKKPRRLPKEFAKFKDIPF